MGLYRRGKIYWCSIKLQGQRIQESLQTDNRKLAEKLYAKVYTDALEGRYFEQVKAKRILFAEMAEKYLGKYEKLRDRTSLKRLMPVFGQQTLAEITAERISDYHRDRLKAVKPATVYQEMALLRRMFNVAIKEWAWVQTNPVSKISFSVGNGNARDRWLSIDEEQQLLDAASPSWLKKLILFALHTGMRRGEILNLKWGDIDLKRRLVTVHKSKNGAKRAIPLSNVLCEILRETKVIDISGKVFPVTVSALKDGFCRAVEKAGLEDFHFHDLRHTFTTRIVQNGIDLYVVKELLGHKTITMTMRYAHHYPESLRKGIEVLDKVCYNFATFGVKPGKETLASTPEFPLKLRGNTIGSV